MQTSLYSCHVIWFIDIILEHNHVHGMQWESEAVFWWGRSGERSSSMAGMSARDLLFTHVNLTISRMVTMKPYCQQITSRRDRSSMTNSTVTWWAPRARASSACMIGEQPAYCAILTLYRSPVDLSYHLDACRLLLCHTVRLIRGQTVLTRHARFAQLGLGFLASAFSQVSLCTVL